LRLVDVAGRLVEHGLKYPNFSVLDAHTPVKNMMHFQPMFTLKYDTGRGCYFSEDDRIVMLEKLRGFANIARKHKCGLVYTPEYSTPREFIQTILADKSQWPSKGKIWVFGVEGTTLEQFSEFERTIRSFSNAEYIQPRDVWPHRYYNMLVYIFIAERDSCRSEKLVIMPQLKTLPSSGESGTMSTGRDVYVFKDTEDTRAFATFICSDAMSGGVEQIIHAHKDSRKKKLIINIQLNFGVDHDDFTGFYKSFFQYSNYDETQVITVNWTNGTSILANGKTYKTMRNAYSARYKKDPTVNDELLYMRNSFGVSLGKLDKHLNTWYAPPHEEHVLRYTLLFGQPVAKHSVLPKETMQNSDNAIYTWDESKQLWQREKKYCMVDWEWLGEAFGLRCKNYSHDPKECKIYYIEKFMNSFEGDEDNANFKLLRGCISIAFKGTKLIKEEDIDGLVGKKTKLESIARIIMGRCRRYAWIPCFRRRLPREFSHFENRNCVFELDNAPKFNLRYIGDNRDGNYKRKARVIYFKHIDSVYTWLKKLKEDEQQKIQDKYIIIYEDDCLGLVFLDYVDTKIMQGLEHGSIV